MKALILSGGTGTRLRPLTYSGAKQLLPVANKPILFYIIEKIVDAGVDDIGIIVGDTCDEIRSAVGEGGKWEVRITYIYQPQPKGLAHAVKTASDFLGGEEFIMVLGDNLFSMELKYVIRDFNSKKVNAQIVLHISEDPSRYGVAVVGREGVIRLVEKPKDPPSNLIITGIYVFDHTIFDAIDKTKPSDRGELEITDAIQKLIDTGGSVGYTLTEGWWKDTGCLEDLLEANRLVLNDIKPETGSIQNRDTVINGTVRAENDVAVTGSLLQGPVVIGHNVSIRNCRIGPYSSIGDNTVLSNCSIENSILIGNTEITGTQKPISASLIGKNARIEDKGEKLDAMTFFIGSDCKIII